MQQPSHACLLLTAQWHSHRVGSCTPPALVPTHSPLQGKPQTLYPFKPRPALQFNGTRVTVDPAALLDGRLPRRALWATIVDAALAGQLSLGNVQRPAVGIEDLSDICDIYRVRLWLLA